MKLIVGLGNPGEKYKNNRHNVGFMVVDALANKLASYQVNKLVWRAEEKFNSLLATVSPQLVLVKPQTFMNDSGRAVQALVRWFKIKHDELYVIHDDLDIPLGGYKIQKGKGPKDHNGIISVSEKLGTEDYWRVRVGVDNRNPENRISGEQYTLEDFTKEEQIVLDGVIGEIAKRLLTTT